MRLLLRPERQLEVSPSLLLQWVGLDGGSSADSVRSVRPPAGVR